MLRIIGGFVAGVFVGQEYGNKLPKADHIIKEIKQTESYKKIEQILKKN